MVWRPFLFKFRNMEKYYLCASNERNYEIVASEKPPKGLYDGGKFWSRGIAYKSLEELKENEGVFDFPCCECGGVVASKNEETQQLMADRKMCSTCLFWIKIVEEKKDRRRIITNNNAYWIRTFGQTDRNGVIGFGGRKFDIKMNNGEIIKTNDLWHQGEIPPHFRNRLKNNAQFV